MVATLVHPPGPLGVTPPRAAVGQGWPLRTWRTTATFVTMYPLRRLLGSLRRDPSTSIETWRASVTGRRRENQDRCACSTRWAVVSDGMGGHAGGARAATLTCDAAVRVLEDAARSGCVASPETAVADAVDRANIAVRQGRADRSVADMGATLVLAVATSVDPASSGWLVGAIGDSPAWVVTATDARQLTTDRTLAASIDASRTGTGEEPVTGRARHLLTRAVGIETEAVADLYTVVLEAGDALVLGSDGVSDVLDATAIGEIVRTGVASDPAGALVERALDAGSNDNVTVVVLRHRTDTDVEPG
ncbi:hypothetical protein BH23ACT2_BH23ACT2_06140 [soil metagenome]